MKEKIINFTKEKCVPVSVTTGATILTPFISCGIGGFTGKNFGLSFLGSLIATGSAIGTAVLDSKFGPDLYEKIYSGDNQYIKAVVEYGIPSLASAILPAVSGCLLGCSAAVIAAGIVEISKGYLALVLGISAMAQTAVLKHFDTVSAFEEAFFGEEIGLNSDQDQIPVDL